MTDFWKEAEAYNEELGFTLEQISFVDMITGNARPHGQWSYDTCESVFHWQESEPEETTGRVDPATWRSMVSHWQKKHSFPITGEFTDAQWEIAKAEALRWYRCIPPGRRGRG